ncbi:MAG: endopeptidase La [Deltaproteobacteria bacterium]|nr:endopeptidase La [Deltaproteobacteria bacterium]
MPSPVSIPSVLPIYPIKEQIIFPYMVLPIFYTRGTAPIIEEAMRTDQLVGMVYCPGEKAICSFDDHPRVGTVCKINQLIKFPNGGGKATVEGISRFAMHSLVTQDPCLMTSIRPIPEQEAAGVVSEALVQSVNALLKIALAYGQPLPENLMKMIDRIDHPGRLADMIAVYIGIPIEVQQQLLTLVDPIERLKSVFLHLADEVQKMQVKGEIQTEVSKRLGKSQKEHILREQMKQIQQELGEQDPRQAEISELRTRIRQSNMPDDVLLVAEKELRRLEQINPASPEYTVSRSYLDYLCSAPWKKGTDESLDINQAEEILNEDHYGLKEVKQRILEYLAVRSLRAATKGPILCFVGPPGVGKTSLGRSIARAMGRKFIRFSLGGMKDEAEIRGHRRTYIGALPGRVIQELCRAESNNPVFMLDEVDKIGQDFRGDPSSALLEVLDPEQNDTFKDHYLDVPFDLSKVMFITTANLLDPIPHALKDRMEVIRLSGYSDEDKLQIAYKYLIPKTIEENGLAGYPLTFSEEAVGKITHDYTREAGVRNLERKIAAVCRKVAREITRGDEPRKVIHAADVEELLGPCTYFIDIASEEDRIGVVTGLAWTESGGDILFIEAAKMPGHKNLTLTGSLGDVMQESARAALTYVRSRAEDFGIAADFFEKYDLHIHVPSGAIPKDGPSAGVTIATAIISLLTGRPARRDIAMTGELTLSGRILPIGGVKEKILAARRAGVKIVLLPARNKEHLVELEDVNLDDIRVELVETIDQIIEQILLPV